MGIFLVLLTVGIFHIQSGGKISPPRKVPIDYGVEVKVDINGDRETERVYVRDMLSGDNAFTQVSAEFADGNIAFTDYPDYWSSYLVTGDLSGDGIADAVVVRISTGSTYGGGEVCVLHMKDNAWEEYPCKLIPNPRLDAIQPDNFEPGSFDFSCLGATIIEKTERPCCA